MQQKPYEVVEPKELTLRFNISSPKSILKRREKFVNYSDTFYGMCKITSKKRDILSIL